MAKNGPIIIVEDDIHDQQQIKEALSQIQVKNRLEVFSSAEEAIIFLSNTPEKPFIILTKMILPGMDGLTFLERIYGDDHLKNKTIPFIFFANVDFPEMVAEAYDMRVQGYFVKPPNFIGLKLILFSITDYWQRAVHPSNLKRNGTSTTDMPNSEPVY